ncbi:MAG: hypothetical protein H7Z41_07925 [Cytophagales bacterium]|nr:hypothetical protein [Armatimonadota bacterium]
MKSGQLSPVRRGGYALFGTAAAAVVVAGAALASSSVKLVINGNPVTTDARQIGGRTYVPVDDVAKALGLKVYSGGGQIALRPAGGANQVGKLQGKIGEELFTGKYKFIVNSVVETQKYQMKYANNRIYNQTVTAGQNEKLIIVDCRLKNGTALKDEFVFYSGTTYNFGGNTALTSFDETSKAPHAYDVAPDEGSPDGAFVLPGAAIRFAIVFKVTPDTRPKDLVYTIVRYAERTEDNGTTVRVSLAK